MSALDTLIYGVRDVFKDGVQLLTRTAVDFKGAGWGVVDNPATKRTEITFTGSSVTDPTTGFEIPILPQVDETIDTTDATPTDLATITLDADTDYDFSVWCMARAASYASVTRFIFDEAFYRHGTGGATSLEKTPGSTINPLAITGLQLVTSGNDVIVRWTGHASTTLAGRVQVGYVKRLVRQP